MFPFSKRKTEPVTAEVTALDMRKKGLEMRIRSLDSQIKLSADRKKIIHEQIKLAKDTGRKETLQKQVEAINKKQEQLRDQLEKLRDQKHHLSQQKEAAMTIVISRTFKRLELAFNEDDFKTWDSTKQRQWLKEHPDSKFGQQSAPVKLQKVKADKEEAFRKMLESKSDSDKQAFIQARHNGVAIPPAWTHVKYFHEPVNGVIAQGLDSKGRRQRLEDAAFREGKIAEKHKRIQDTLEPKFDSIVRKLRKQAESSVEAQVLYLITQTGFRIGGEGDGKTEHTAYGASNLLGKHVTVDGDKVSFDFTGKEGVRQVHSVKDPLIAKMMANKQDDERIFQTNEEKIRKVWKALGGEKVHDIRSVLATRLAKKTLAKLIPPEPKTKKELLDLQKKAAEVASKRLGNRPSEALNTYIDKNIFPKLEAQ